MKPPTPAPEAGQGPWCSEALDRWWVVADTVGEALTVVADCAPDAFPCYFGWCVKVEPVLIAWSEDYNAEEVCVQEQPYDTEATSAAWRITVSGT